MQWAILRFWVRDRDKMDPCAGRAGCGLHLGWGNSSDVREGRGVHVTGVSRRERESEESLKCVPFLPSHAGFARRGLQSE